MTLEHTPDERRYRRYQHRHPVLWPFLLVPSGPDRPSCGCSCITALLAAVFTGLLISFAITLWWGFFLTWPWLTLASTVIIILLTVIRYRSGIDA